MTQIRWEWWYMFTSSNVRLGLVTRATRRECTQVSPQHFWWQLIVATPGLRTGINGSCCNAKHICCVLVGRWWAPLVFKGTTSHLTDAGRFRVRLFTERSQHGQKQQVCNWIFPGTHLTFWSFQLEQIKSLVLVILPYDSNKTWHNREKISFAHLPRCVFCLQLVQMV